MADNQRVITGQKMDEPTPPNTFPDFDWARDNRDRLREEYGGTIEVQKVLLIFNKQVVGYGDTVEDARLDAEARLAPEVEKITPIVFLVGGFDPRIRILQKVQPGARDDN